MYKVINDFIDLEDDRRLYEAGHTYPRDDYKPSEQRLKVLSSKNNKAKKVLIQKAEDSKENAEKDKFPLHKGGGSFILSNGETVRGKDAAIEAENKLKSGE